MPPLPPQEIAGRTRSDATALPRYAGLAVVVAALLLPTAARAADCPEVPGDAIKARNLAKEWFSRAEAAEIARDEVAAARAYACSFSLVPHPSTAYNLARAAERAGDLALALSAHRDYLSLAPDAPDRAEIEARITSLRGRLAAAPPPPAPAETVTASPAAPPRGHSLADRMGTAEWVIAGVGAAGLVAGVVFNVGARAAMSDCRSMAHANSIVGAREACDRAKPFAYASYTLFGVAALSAVADAALIWTRGTSAESVSLLVLPGGAGVAASGRF